MIAPRLGPSEPSGTAYKHSLFTVGEVLKSYELVQPKEARFSKAFSNADQVKISREQRECIARLSELRLSIAPTR